MKERPILFRPELVRAIFDGRKTVTRRVVKPQPDRVTERSASLEMGRRIVVPDGWRWRDALYVADVTSCPAAFAACLADHNPYGASGDRLWVRETWHPRIHHTCGMDDCDCGDVVVTYSDGSSRLFRDAEIDESDSDWQIPKSASRGNVPSIFMPRWASRLSLEITGVGVERLQEITEADARAEGIPSFTERFENVSLDQPIHGVGRAGDSPYKASFACGWDEINGDRDGGACRWHANPWVWVVRFKVAEAARRAA